MPTIGYLQGPILSLSGSGFRAAIFHLGALTRLNELGLLCGAETVRAVAGGSIVAALLATRVTWPLHGAFRDWPEEIGDPIREIARREPRFLPRLPGPFTRAGDAFEEERFARRLLETGPAGPHAPRLIFGAAGLALSGIDPGAAGELEVRWELGRPLALAGYDSDLVEEAIATMPAGLSPLGDGDAAVLENHGYLIADAALRAQERRPPALEPLPPEPPHPHLTSEAGMRPGLRLAELPRWRRPVAHEEPTELLDRYRPFIRYDSLESYRADSVAIIAELVVGARCNSLHRADGTMLACASPAPGAARLDLDYLGAPMYRDGRRALPGDYLDECGGSHASDALAARRRDGCADVVYGRATRSEGRLWLQYWLFYYYNDKGFLKVGRHEGDWEMVQVRIGDDGRPDAVTFRQHGGGMRAAWPEVETEETDQGEAPVVYCARGSHASLPRPGTLAAPVVPDHSDGQGPIVRPTLVRIGGDGPGWAHWPGRWGATRRREAFEGNSPSGPAQHAQWREPAAFHREARPLAEAPAWREPRPAAPLFRAHRDGDNAVLTYRIDRGAEGAAPARIVAGAFGGGAEGGIVAHSFQVEGPEGVCVLPAPFDGSLHGIRACATSELGTPGETVNVPLA